MIRRLICSLCAVVLLFAACAQGAELPFLHPLFTNNAVLQRGIAVPVWGWTTAGASVTVTVQNAEGATVGEPVTATAKEDGKWMVRVGALEAGGPYTLLVKGPQEAKITNLLLGDVWLCSGQSNMQMGIGACNNAKEEIASATFPQIRLFTVPRKPGMQPQAVVQGQWQVCSPETVGSGGWAGFSAVGFFFGRHLNQELKIPIGLIHSSWGGTIAEAWTSAEALQTMPDFADPLKQFAAFVKQREQGGYNFEEEMRTWWVKSDPHSEGDDAWWKPDLETDDWKTTPLPQSWEKGPLPNFDGIVWFRFAVDLPADWVGKALKLSLGPIDDQDTTWVNGTLVGGMTNWQAPRQYSVPATTMKAGRNVIAVRVLDTGGGGGFHGKPEQLTLKVDGDADASLSLAGEWQFNVGSPLNKLTPAPKRQDNSPNVVTVLYNGMIAPLLPYGIKGAIWYQGESNAGRAEQYGRLLPTMIGDWRKRFGVGDFPFGIVQLAAFMPRTEEPMQSGWAELRDAQLMTAQAVKNAGIAVATDIGDAKDIHPRNKQDVGKRLALWALGTAYGKDIVYSGPEYSGMKVEDGRIRLSFNHVGGGLVAKENDGKLFGFAIAGVEGKFVWAEAAIEGDAVVCSHPDIPQPTTVRYGWANNPDRINLYNKEGLPATPFRTDRLQK